MSDDEVPPEFPIEELQRLLGLLTPEERQVLLLRFGLDRGEPRTLEETGAIFETDRETIRRIEARAMDKLRADYEA